ncbi:hypothetical protein EKO27_g687 [Xylaria grammica]|uniref:Rhodopsin domain-containing protein n=1 Tax=Xylaria grammica TaxID=363999 RepID=A0A439DJ51_9PEZI|nr:hypothetical protein EKO27_g687 [Xylaria grammica]
MFTIDTSNLSPEQLEEVMNGPALDPPPGVVPNFDHPPNENYWGIAADVICSFVVLVVVVLRACAKIFCIKERHIEDWLMVPALFIYGGGVYCDIWMIKDGGLFVHQWNIRMKDLSNIFRELHIGANLCTVTIMLLKASILLDWKRIFVPLGTRNWFYWITWVVLITHTVFYVTWIFLVNLSCMPHQKIWDITVTEGHCLDIKIIYTVAGAVNVFANFVILLLPLWTIHHLQMSKKRKGGVYVVFGVGVGACVAAAVRLHVSVYLLKSEDIVYSQAKLYLLALAEMTCLFLVLCVPTIPRVFAELGRTTKIKALLPWCSKAGEGDVVFTTPKLSSIYRQWEGAPPGSADSVGVLTTVVMAGGRDDRAYRGTTGILRTREFTLTTEDPTLGLEIAPTDIEAEIKEYHDYLRTTMF